METVRLVTAEKITAERARAILAPLIKGRKVRILVELDPALLAGYVLYADNKRIDNSLSHQLRYVEQQLLEGIDPSKVRKAPLVVEEIGQVNYCSDGIAFCTGLDKVMSNELLRFDNGVEGIAMNLNEDMVGVILLGGEDSVKSGDICVRSYKTAAVPSGRALIGRVVDSLGHPLDGKAAFAKDINRRELEQAAPAVVDRQSVAESIYTGITAIDAMIPIGKGQRELIIGDRQTGKTSIASDMVLNQKGKNVYCIYVAIGQKMSTISALTKYFADHGAMDYTTIVAASASCSAAELYIAPYAACAMAEELMFQGEDVLIIYDDLSKHAQAYRALSLLLRRPPGREAYPGDVFYIHSRLLERAAKLSDELGAGSITAIPIIETQGGDISAYIPTNVISITDGQIYLESDLFFSGQRPAINVGLSVSRVGGDAQASVMRKTAGPLRVQLAQFRELQAFSQFGSDLDKSTQESLELGSRLNEVLKQGKAQARQMEESVVLLQLAIHNDLRDVALEDIQDTILAYLDYLRENKEALLLEVANSKRVEEALYQKILESFISFRKLGEKA